MSCVSLSLTPPLVPGVLIPNESFVVTIPYGQVGVSCCSFSLPGFQIPIPIPSVGAILLLAITALNAAIQTALQNYIVVPSCPTDGNII